MSSFKLDKRLRNELKLEEGGYTNRAAEAIIAASPGTMGFEEVEIHSASHELDWEETQFVIELDGMQFTVNIANA